jgi:HD-like signal output (HDOD) protein
MEILSENKVNTDYVNKQLRKIGSLPSTYNIFPEIIKLVNDSSKSIFHFESVIKKDPALTAKVLRIINSPYYGLSRNISQLRQALTLLGVENLYRIVLSASYYNNYRKIFKNTLFDFNLYWQHFEMTAAVSQILAEHFIPEKSAEAHLIGLLHDSGKLIIDQYFHKEWDLIILEYKKKKRKILDIERDLLGLDHATLAAELFKIWNFPDEIVEPIRYHHNPLEAQEYEKLAALIFIADKIASALISNRKVRETTQESTYFEKEWNAILEKYPQLSIVDINNEDQMMDFEEIVKKRIYHR